MRGVLILSMSDIELFVDKIVEICVKSAFFIFSLSPIYNIIIGAICLFIALILEKFFIVRYKRKYIIDLEKDYEHVKKSCTVCVPCMITDIEKIKDYYYPVVDLVYENQGYSARLGQFLVYFKEDKEPEKTGFLFAIYSWTSTCLRKPTFDELEYQVGDTIDICFNPNNLREYYSPTLLNSYYENLEKCYPGDNKLNFLFYLKNFFILCGAFAILTLLG